MILHDTNVISELFRPTPNPTVIGWFANTDSSHLYLSTITETELRYGIFIMPEGKRRESLNKAIDGTLREDFGGRILSFDRIAASACALIRARRKKLGHGIGIADAQIAGRALSRTIPIATRNSGDFQNCGVELIDLSCSQ